ncbi:LuxR family transcriptional regulator [Phyllobacterium pellucidum]|uniref:LuxR family transcriptional regulator n=1 Tax=Phyllobacterium pellucidum TaxID=2740464 RepID=UPI0013AEE4C3|nr:LuxR family transcriptional regulator [Phyllobacterium sp. T1018]UGY08745.1 LuxR family transcriptional regulator [Phyllobacterium sp. T1018]
MTSATAHSMNLDPNFLNLIEEATSVRHHPQVHELIGRLATIYELSSVAYVGVNLPGPAGGNRYVSTTFLPDWINRYNDQNYWQLDPVLKQGFSSILPIDWGKFDVTRPPLRRFFGEAVEFGVGRHGLSFPVRGRYGEKALLSVSSNMPLGKWIRFMPFWTRDFQILAFHIHQMVLRAEGHRDPKIKLSPRELECLKWSAAGKSAGEIGTILSLSEKTVRFYQDLARRKLDAKNLTHAVAKLYSLDLL